MSKNKTVYLLILALSFLAIVSLPTGIFGYDSTQECFYEELTKCGGGDDCGEPALTYCREEYGAMKKETRPRSEFLFHTSNAKCQLDLYKNCDSKNPEDAWCWLAVTDYCDMYHPKEE